MKKKILILTIAFLFVLISSCVVLGDDNYKNISTKFFTDQVNKTVCFEQFNFIPFKYWEGISLIRIYPQDVNPLLYGNYYFGKKILVIMGLDCDLNVIVHELAHHKQNMMNEPWHQMRYHMGNFDKYEMEIMDSVIYGVK